MKKRTFIKLSSLTMAGTVLSPLINLAQEDKLKNWAGNYVYSTNRLQAPQSIAEVQSFVREHEKFKVLGTRHCFNNIADSRDYLLSSGKLNKIISLDKNAQTVTVEAGIRYGELATYLFSNGYALHNLASLPHISIAGACATATHGSGVKNGNLSSAVVAMEIVTAAGDVIHLSKEKDGETFQGAVVNLGGIGVITKLTLSVQPTFMIRQDVYENLSLLQLEHHFDEIMSSGYSVSLFTDWRNKNFSEVWIKSRMDQDVNPVLKPEFFGATAAVKIFTRLLSYLLKIVPNKWEYPDPGMNDCLISKWVLHQAVVKNCNRNILFPGINHTGPYLL